MVLGASLFMIAVFFFLSAAFYREDRGIDRLTLAISSTQRRRSACSSHSSCSCDQWK
jgi:hypothetical protein